MIIPRLPLSVASALILVAVVADCGSGASARMDPPGPSTSSIDQLGRIVVDGQPFVPIGLYGPNFREPLDDRKAALGAIAAIGCNTVVLEDVSTPDFGQLLDEADRLGLKVIVASSSLADNAYIGATVDAYRRKPAVMGWSLFDDADDGAVTVEQVAARSVYVKSRDPNHLTLSPLTGFFSERRAARAGIIAASDASSLEMYPIGPPADYAFEYGGDPLRESYSVSRDYVASSETAGTAMLVNSQMFSWSSDGTAYPTAAQLRNMVYGQLAAGADGIVAYGYSPQLVAEAPGLWTEFSALARDMTASLDEPLRRGAFARGPVVDGAVVYATWRLDDSITIVVVNDSSTASAGVDVPVPEEYRGALTPLIDRLPSTLALENGRVTGSLAPAEVQVYRIPSR